MKIRYINIPLIALTALLLLGCSNKRNTFVSRQYHDATAYFNVLFNGKDAFNQGFKKAEATEPAGFDEVLPVFSFDFETVPGIVASDMQRTIEKTKKTVTKHSITAKPKKKSGMTKEDREFYNKREFNILIDDAYLLMGQANIFLRDYDEAKRALEFATQEYPKESSIYDTRLWLAVVQAKRGDLGTAENAYKLLGKDKKFPEKLQPVLDAAWADLKIKQKNYPEAISYLEKALSKTSRKSTKIRYNYILAQLNERIGDKTKSLVYYDRVIKMNPPYFTSFSAQMAKVFSYDSLTQKADIRKTLEKALKDNRNEEYQDQIYYALATVEKADNNIDKALEYYQKAINVGGINDRQKALSYNALANYYYTLPNYVRSYHYFDSSARYIGAEHSRYEEITGKTLQLKKLADNLEVIGKQDSLQHIAKLPANERNKLIDKQVEKAVAAENEQKQTQQQQTQQQQEQIYQADRNKSMNETTAQNVSGQWYFYNTTALSLGLSDFQMRWGRRKLEDNWRRRNRSIQTPQENNESFDKTEKLTITEFEKQKKGLTEKDKEFYLLDVPVGDEAMNESNKRVLNAMFNVGEAFRDDLKNYPASIKAFEDMISRYPNSELQPQAYIALYNLNKEQGDSERATYYRNLMALNYPDNPQVKATLDPAYVTQLQAQEYATEAAYTLALAQYSQGNYQQALQMAEKVINSEPKNTLLPQYYLLKALSTDYRGDTVLYVSAMDEVIAKFPKNDVAVQAKKLLDELYNKDGMIDGELQEQQVEQPVTVNYTSEDGEHYLAIFVSSKGDANELKFNITTRNADLFLNENYEVSDADMGLGNKLVIVGTFKNKAAAMKYYNDALKDKTTIFGEQPESAFTTCVISDINLLLLKQSKYFTGYYNFFQNSYLNK